MLRSALVYGTLSGLGIILAMLLGMVLSDMQGFFASEYFGYLVMLLALSLIFVGVRRYREIERGGVIKFTEALGLGLMMAAVAAVIYVIVWEIYLAATDYAFMTEYVAGVIEAKKAAGVSGAALDEQIAKLDQMKEQYRNPLFRVPITFLEMFPIGAVVALVSAGLLRKPEILPSGPQ